MNTITRIAVTSLALGILFFVATPSVEAHTETCYGSAIQGGTCLILCGVEHAITAPPHSCNYCPTDISICLGA